jgi:hypothetical protein
MPALTPSTDPGEITAATEGALEIQVATAVTSLLLRSDQVAVAMK